MIVGAWSNIFSHQSISDIDEATMIGRKIGNLEVTDFANIVSDIFDSQRQFSGRNSTPKSLDLSGHHLWDHNIPFKYISQKSTSLMKRTPAHNQRVTPLLQRGLVFFHMGRWSEAATMSTSAPQLMALLNGLK